MTSRTRHPKTGAPLLHYEVHPRGLTGTTPCGIVPEGEAAAAGGPTCTDVPVARLTMRFRDGAQLESPICRVHLGSILEQLSANNGAPPVFTPGLN